MDSIPAACCAREHAIGGIAPGMPFTTCNLSLSAEDAAKLELQTASYELTSTRFYLSDDGLTFVQ